MTSAPPSTTQRLSAAEAETLWSNWKLRRDSSSRDRLILSYAPMVRYIASRKVRELPDHCDLDDLTSSGLVALMESIDRLDPAQGASFEQYARTRVAGALVDELRRQDWASRPVRRAGRRIDRARDAFFARHGVPPTEVQLASELGLSVAELRTSNEEIDRSDVGSLNSPARGADDGQPIEIGDTVVSQERDLGPEASALVSERNAAMREAIGRLSERERRVLALVHVQELPGAEIGRMLGVSESRVSQILAGIRRKLKNQLTAYDGGAAAA
jgi:RNA polymerase sigma factor for flagellar operon FliA